jgi:RNA polymerase primary sigma factor
MKKKTEEPVISNEVLADRWKNERDAQALETLIKRNRPFVIKTAKKMRLFPCEGKLKSSVLDYDDILSIGDMAICKAADRYEIKTGHKFLTYAGWWIFCELNKAQKDAYGCVALPQKVYAQVVAFTSEINRIEEENSDISDTEAFRIAAKNLHISEAEGDQLRNYARAYLSWSSLDDDRFSADDSGARIVDYQADNSDEENVRTASNRELIECLIQKTPSLTQRDIYIIRSHFALNEDHCEMSYADIGKEINCTRERVRQLCDLAVIALANTAQSLGMGSELIS